MGTAGNHFFEKRQDDGLSHGFARIRPIMRRGSTKTIAGNFFVKDLETTTDTSFDRVAPQVF